MKKMCEYSLKSINLKNKQLIMANNYRISETDTQDKWDNKSLLREMVKAPDDLNFEIRNFCNLY